MRGKRSRRAGRTVRDIVENDPGQVGEVWCRKLFRQLLQVLERQYALRLPHRAITPDTIVFQDDGAALLPSLVSDPRPELADDLTALARTVHYAITHEPVPAGPLRGRALAGYSDSLITAVDRSMDPARRPHTIGELRIMLGIVATGPPQARTQLAAAPASKAPPALPPLEPTPFGPMRFQHWAVVGGGVACLLLAAHAMFAHLRGPSALDRIAQPLPEPGAIARAPSDTAIQAAPGPIVPVPVPVPEMPANHAMGRPVGEQADASGAQAAAPARQADTRQVDARQRDARQAGDTAARPSATHRRDATRERDAARQRNASQERDAARQPDATRQRDAARQRDATRPRDAAAPKLASNPPRSAAPRAPAPSTEPTVATPPGAPADAVFTLRIQPWGVIHVDGVERGISPPVKQLVLAPGRHSILVTNPGSGKRVLEVDAARGGGHIAVNFDGGSR